MVFKYTQIEAIIISKTLEIWQENSKKSFKSFQNYSLFISYQIIVDNDSLVNIFISHMREILIFLCILT